MPCAASVHWRKLCLRMQVQCTSVDDPKNKTPVLLSLAGKSLVHKLGGLRSGRPYKGQQPAACRVHIYSPPYSLFTSACTPHIRECFYMSCPKFDLAPVNLAIASMVCRRARCSQGRGQAAFPPPTCSTSHPDEVGSRQLHWQAWPGVLTKKVKRCFSLS